MTTNNYPGWARASDWLRAQWRAAQETPLQNPPGFTFRDEANVLIAYAVRNGFLEDLHAALPGFTDSLMRKLMIESTAALAALLYLRQQGLKIYADFLLDYRDAYCKAWSRDEVKVDGVAPEASVCTACQERILEGWRFCPTCGKPLRPRKTDGKR